MPQPTSQQVHVDQILTNISVAEIQTADDFIATKVFPIVPVEKQSDRYYIFDRDAWLRDEAQVRGDASESEGSGFTLSDDSYNALVYALHKDIGSQALANADAPINLFDSATRFVTRQLLMRQEKDWDSTFFTTGVWDTDQVGGTNFTQWNDFGASDPADNVDQGKQTMLSNTGFEPNVLILSYPVFRQLRRHPDVRDQFKYTSSESITQDMLARYFDIDAIEVVRSIENTANEGGTLTTDFISGKHALLLYVPSSAGLLTPSAGYTFAWQGVSQGLGENVGVARFEMPQLKATRVEAEAAWDFKVIASELGYFFQNAVA